MRTEENLELLEAALQSNCGDFYDACRQALLAPAFVRKWMADDTEVKERLSSAETVGAMQLESAAIQRAVKGYEEDVYYKGEVVGQQTKYSDPLLMHLMKGKLRDRYGDDAGQQRVVNYGTINIMPRAESYEDWLMMQKNTEQHLLEDQRVEDAEFSMVLPPPEEDPAMADLL